MNIGLNWLARYIKIKDTELLLNLNLTDSQYGIKLESKSYFTWNEKSMVRVERLMDDLLHAVRNYWNEGKGKLNEINDRPAMDAILRNNGWILCPYCKMNFATYSSSSWRDNTHLSCGTKLRLKVE